MDIDKEKKEKSEEPVVSPFIEDSFEDIDFVEEDGEGNTLSPDAKIKKLRAELARANKERTEYLTGWQRAQADYVNLKKEEQGKREALSLLIKEDFVESLLPALDSFTMAMSNKEVWEKVDPNWRTGVEYIHTQILKALGDHGVLPIDQTNIPIDGFLHQAISVLETEDSAKDDTVADVVQVGYKIGDKVIRPARVVVFKASKS